MPTSSPQQIGDVVDAVLSLRPVESVLEIGIGYGKYGALVREYLDVWEHYFEPWGANHATIHGVEVHDMYSDSPLWGCYDRVDIADARLYTPTQPYDVCLMVDVLEHFNRIEGNGLLKILKQHCTAFVIAVPTIVGATVEVWDNPHEIHQENWGASELRALGFTVETVRNNDATVMICR